MSTYREFISAQSYRNPCLANLCNFLHSPHQHRINHIDSLEFSSGQPHPNHRLIKPDCIPEFSQNALPGADKILGRIIIVEDLDNDIIELLGRSFGIEPLFFASHIHAPWWESSFRTPEMAALPSRMKPQRFINIHYHRTVLLYDQNANTDRLASCANVRRKVNVLSDHELSPFNNGGKVALIQQCCSVYSCILQNKTWLCIVLVDSPLRDTFVSSANAPSGPFLTQIQTQLFLGGYEDFNDPPSVFDRPAHNLGPSRRCLLEDLLFYWQFEPPAFFSPTDPTTFSLSYLPLRIAAAEWSNFMTVMNQSIKQVEYSLGDDTILPSQLSRLASDMRALQSWRRRTMTSLRKLSTITHFLHHHHRRRRDRRRTTPPTEPPAIHTLLADFRHIAAHVADSGRRLERALPVVPSVLTLAEGRLALREARGAARLARLALVFVPLSFAAGLFGMDAAFAPGGPRFWVYVAVAAPLTALVCAVARLSAPAAGDGGWGRWKWRFLGSGAAGA